MEIAARFIALAHLDLPFPEYSREFCGLAAATALDDATILSLFWYGANSHRPLDLPDTTGLCWWEGILWCLESFLPRARTSLPPSAALPNPPPFVALVIPPSAGKCPPPFAAKAGPPAVKMASLPAETRASLPAMSMVSPPA